MRLRPRATPKSSPRAIRVALVHDWLTGMRGGEYVLEAIAELFPDAELFTLLYVPGSVSSQLANLRRHSSWLEKLPAAHRYYRHCLPLLPMLVEGFDLEDFDLVISSSHCVAKGVRKGTGAVHVSYVHAPMRYMWDRFDDYFGPGTTSLPIRAVARLLRPHLQRWDREVSRPERVDLLIANSHFVAERIERAYGREACVVHPFADAQRFQATRIPGREYLMVGAFAPNKRVDLAIEAFNRLKLPLLIVGQGQEKQRLENLAGPTVTFLGPLDNADIEKQYARARAFIFPGVEDFGITPLEAMAAGLPVIAYAAGGALETVADGVSGILFAPQSVEALVQAVQRFESGSVVFDEAKLRARALEFSRRRFQARLLGRVRQAWIATGKPESLLPIPAWLLESEEPAHELRSA